MWGTRSQTTDRKAALVTKWKHTQGYGHKANQDIVSDKKGELAIVGRYLDDVTVLDHLSKQLLILGVVLLLFQFCCMLGHERKHVWDWLHCSHIVQSQWSKHLAFQMTTYVIKISDSVPRLAQTDLGWLKEKRGNQQFLHPFFDVPIES